MNAVIAERLATGTGWERIVDLSRDMLCGAREGRWDQVCTLQEERFRLVRQYLAAARPPEELARLRPQVASLLDMDAEVVALGRRRRARLGEELRQLRHGRAARKAYGA